MSFLGNTYWKFDDASLGEQNSCSSELSYPRDMGVWKGVKLPVHAAVTSFDGKTTSNMASIQFYCGLSSLLIIASCYCSLLFVSQLDMSATKRAVLRTVTFVVETVEN